MSIKSTVNTNISGETQLVANRGNLASSVYAFDMGTAPDAAGAVQTFDASVLTDGTETIGAYAGTLEAGGGAAAGVVQVITMTFATAHGWTAKTHDLDITLVGTAAESKVATVGTASGSFNTSTIVVRREAGAIADVGGETRAVNLTPAVMLVRVRRRGVVKTTP